MYILEWRMQKLSEILARENRRDSEKKINHHIFWHVEVANRNVLGLVNNWKNQKSKSPPRKKKINQWSFGYICPMAQDLRVFDQLNPCVCCWTYTRRGAGLLYDLEWFLCRSPYKYCSRYWSTNASRLWQNWPFAQQIWIFWMHVS